nr:hypothetical protein Itr_chr11CG18270 [Ipomoea trifida]
MAACSLAEGDGGDDDFEKTSGGLISPSPFSDGTSRVTTRRSSPFVDERLPQPRRLAELVGMATQHLRLPFRLSGGVSSSSTSLLPCSRRTLRCYVAVLGDP